MTDHNIVTNSQTQTQLVNFSELDKQAELFKSSKKTLSDNSELIQKAIDDNTKEEIQRVQQAIANLNKKVEKIMDTEYVKDKKTKIEEAQKQMMTSIKEASNTFFQVRTVIRAKEHLSTKEKQEYEDKLFHKIIDKFMTKEEKDLFIQIINAGPMLMLGGRGGGGLSRLGGMIGF